MPTKNVCMLKMKRCSWLRVGFWARHSLNHANHGVVFKSTKQNVSISLPCLVMCRDGRVVLNSMSLKDLLDFLHVPHFPHMHWLESYGWEWWSVVVGNY